MDDGDTMSQSDWIKGIALSVIASVVGGASKLAIRKSWLLEQSEEEEEEIQQQEDQPGAMVIDLNDNTDIGTDRSNNDNNLHHCHNNVCSSQQYKKKGEAGLIPIEQDFLDSSYSPGLVSDNISSGGGNIINNVAQHSKYPRENKTKIAIYRSNIVINQMNSSLIEKEDNSDDGGVNEDLEGEQDECNRSEGTAAVETSEQLQQQQQPLDYSTDDKSGYVRCCAITLRIFGMFGMTFVNPFFGLLAMNYASPSITAPFSGLTLVWIILFSKTLLGEEASTSQIFAGSLIILGEIIVSVFGDHTNDVNTTVHDVEESYLEIQFILFNAFLILWMIMIAYWMQLPSSSGSNAASNSNASKKRFAWGVSGGTVTGMAQSFIKDSLTLLKSAKGEDGQKKNFISLLSSYPWYTPVFISVAVLGCFSGLLLLTATMKRYDATYSSGMFIGSFIISASIMSAVHYKTFQHLDHTLNFFLYPIGLIILMLGVYILLQVSKEQVPCNDDCEGHHQQQRQQGQHILVPNTEPFEEHQQHLHPYHQQQMTELIDYNSLNTADGSAIVNNVNATDSSNQCHKRHPKVEVSSLTEASYSSTNYVRACEQYDSQ